VEQCNQDDGQCLQSPMTLYLQAKKNEAKEQKERNKKEKQKKEN
jgi:hypothetical protein